MKNTNEMNEFVSRNSLVEGQSKETLNFQLSTFNSRLSTLVLIVFCLFFGGKAWGQTTNQLLSENFDAMSSISTSYSANGWYAYNAGSGNNWSRYQGNANSGSYSVRYNYNSSNSANCYLVSAPFSVSANMSELSVSLYENTGGWNETFEVFFVKASDVTTVAAVASATHYSAIASNTYTNSSYAQKSGSSTNSALAGQSVRVVVHCTSAADQYWLCIDDITVTETVRANICQAPSSASVTNVTSNSVTLEWLPGGTDTQWWIFYDYKENQTNPNWQWNTERIYEPNHSYTITGLNPSTEYVFRIFSVCDTYINYPDLDATTDCTPSNKCEISCFLTDSYGDGWNGNSISVVDAATGTILATWTISSGSSNTETLSVCNGRNINFVWTQGSYSYETSFVMYDANGDEIYSIDDGSTLSSGTFYTYTANCSSCPKPTGLTASNVTDNSADLAWTGSADSYNVRYGRKYTFDDGTMQGWTTIDGGTPQGYGWQIGSGVFGNGLGHDDSDDLVLSQSFQNGYGAVTPDNYLISPRINFGDWTNITFWAKGQDPSYPAEHFGVAVSTAGNASASDFAMVSPEYIATGDWVQYIVDLSAYSGLQGYVAIRHFNCSDQYLLDVDDIAITTDMVADVTGSPYTLSGLIPETEYVASVQSACEDNAYSSWSDPVEFTTTEPPYLAQWVSDGTVIDVSDWCTGDTRQVTLKVKNVGTATWKKSSTGGDSSTTPTNSDVVVVAYKWDEDPDYDEHPTYEFTADVAPDGIGTVTFNVEKPRQAGPNHLKFNLRRMDVCWFSEANYAVEKSVTINVPTPTLAIRNDNDLASCLDGSKEVKIVAGLPGGSFFDDFENGLGNWQTSYTNSSDYQWQQSEGTGLGSHTLAYSGQGNAAVAYDGSVLSYAYMKLNKDLSSYTDIKLSFWYKNPYGSYYDKFDYFYVERSTDGSNWSEVTSYNETFHNIWNHVSNISIPDGTKYIRFSAYIRGDYYGNGVAVDDVSITYIDPSPSSFSWSATTGSTTGTSSGNTYTVTPTARHNTYTATSGGCSSSISIDVMGDLTASDETIDCGASVTLSASGIEDVTYNWYDNSSVLLQENSSTFNTGVLIGNATYKVDASFESGFNTMVYDEPGDYTLEIPDGVTSVLVETWGAQGGSSHDAGIFYDNRGGKGGYSKGTYTVSSTGQTLYICVGGRGEDGAFRTSSSAPVLNADGGYNGGGKGAGDEHTDNTHETGGGGGGASHVAIAMPQLSTVEGIQLQNYSNNRNDVLVVAGGGGGSSCQAPGGCGGGATGGDAYWAGGEPHDPWQQDNTGGGRGGSESTNGTFTYVNKNGNSFTPPVTKSSGGFGKGADGADNEMANPTIYPNGVAGGGGGYYGGCVYASAENGRRNSGGGGSGYTNTGLLSSFETIDGEHEMPNPNGGTMIGKTGNGYVKITLFGTQTCTSPMVAVPVSVNPANVMLTQLDPQSMCAGTSITLPAHPGASSTNSPEPEYDYSWNAASGLVGSSEGIQISKSGSYTYNVTATLNGNGACTATDSKEVSVAYKTPSASEITAMGLDEISNGDLLWTGRSTDWSTTNNWMRYNSSTDEYTLLSTAPTSSSNVVIGKYSTCVTGTPTLNVNTSASVNTLRIASGITVSGTNTLSMDGNLVNNGTFDAPVRFNGNTTLSGSGTTTFRDITIAGTFNASSASLAVSGDWTNNGTFTANGPVVFAGTSAQTIGGSNATAFNNVTFNNANGISISKEPTINGTATFTSGVVTGNVTFGSSAKVNGASTSSHVDGIVKKNGAAKSTDFYFPTGSNGNLGKVVVTDGTATNVSVQYFSNPAGFSVNDLPRWWASASVSGFDHVSNVEYWKISSTDTITANFIAEASTDMHFNSGTAEEDKIPTNIQMAFYDNNHWTNVGGSASIGNNMLTITGAVIPASTTRGISGNYTTFGSKTASTVLPIELTSFTATCDGRSSLIEWTTATERNNDYFSLERSDDAINFTEIARVAGAGNSIEPLNYSYTDYGIHGGDNYYRLVQVDYDGTRTVSEVIVANCIEPESNGDPDVLAYPNPFSSELTVVLDNFGNRAATIEVYDMLGKLIYTNKISAPQNSYETILNLSSLPSGAYTVRVSTNDFVINRNVVKQ